MAAEVLTVSQLGNKILRQQAQRIGNFSDLPLQTLIDNMLATLKKSNGVGLAAPQVAESLQLFIVASSPNARYPKAPQMEPTAMLNPKIVSRSAHTVKDWEGCLSVPGIRGLVPRHQVIEVEYTNRQGHLQRQELTNFIARIFQHEYDHLNGIVFLDRVESTHDLITEQEYLKLVVQSEDEKAAIQN